MSTRPPLVSRPPFRRPIPPCLLHCRYTVRDHQPDSRDDQADSCSVSGQGRRVVGDGGTRLAVRPPSPITHHPPKEHPPWLSRASRTASPVARTRWASRSPSPTPSHSTSPTSSAWSTSQAS